MNNTHPGLFRKPATAFIIAGLLMSILACKKENDTPEEFPEFGTCEPMPVTGRLTANSSGTTYTYVTSGGSKLVLDMAGSFVITYKDYPQCKLELWGDAGTTGNPINSANHENLNGKHIKDRIDVRRTILLPDGAKLTMLANGFAGTMKWFSIHDGNESFHINAECRKLEYATTNENIAKELDKREADGETATFELTSTGLLYLNIYTEDTPGNKIEKRVLLGELRTDEPSQVRDHYDDPRMGHT